jgi:hypothetical protein
MARNGCWGLKCLIFNALFPQNLGRPPHAARSLGLGPRLHAAGISTHTGSTSASTPHVQAHSLQQIMAAIYKPSEAIALLRPSFLLPRIQNASSRKAHLGRTAFSTTRNAQATQTSTPNTPPPGPTRRSITLTGDNGQVRWSDLSPGEKAVRTTQQSVNLVVVLVGILATVSSHIHSILSKEASHT